MELLASASRQFTPKTMDLSVRFVHSHFVQFFLASDRNGRQKPLAERSALSILLGLLSDNVWRVPVAKKWPRNRKGKRVNEHVKTICRTENLLNQNASASHS